MNDILSINAHLKYVEFLLYTFDKGQNDLTLGNIKFRFKSKFKTLHPLLNQYFGIYRLLPLMLIKEEYKKQDIKLSGNIEKIKIIRDAIAHGNFSICGNGYTFKNNKKELTLSYSDFTAFLHRIETEFYNKNI